MGTHWVLQKPQSPAQLRQRAGWRIERWAILALASHWGGFLCGSDSTMKSRPGIKGSLFLKTTAPTVLPAPRLDLVPSYSLKLCRRKLFTGNLKEPWVCTGNAERNDTEKFKSAAVF